MKRHTTKLRSGLITCQSGGELTSVRWSQDGKRWALTKVIGHIRPAPFEPPKPRAALQLCHAVHVKRQRRNGRLVGQKFTWRKATAGPPQSDWPPEALAMLACAHILDWHLDFVTTRHPEERSICEHPDFNKPIPSIGGKRMADFWDHATGSFRPDAPDQWHGITNYLA